MGTSADDDGGARRGWRFAPDKAPEPDELDVWFSRHRKSLLAGYAAIYLVFVGLCSYSLLISAEAPHLLFNVVFSGAGSPEDFAAKFWHDIQGDPFGLWPHAAFAALYLAFQAAVLWGIGSVSVGREAHRGRVVLAVACVTVFGALLVGGAVALVLGGLSVAHLGLEFTGQYAFVFAVFVSGWLFWVVLAAVYWRGATRRGFIYRLVRALLATSWLEFSLALPIDIAERNRSDCYCGIGSWYTLIGCIPVMVWAFGPALYLIYLRERQLSTQAPGRARAILLAKSRRYARLPQRNVESHVSSARTISLAVVVLGFVGFQLGLYNHGRGASFTATRDLIVVHEIQVKYKSDAQFRQKIDEMRLSPDPSPVIGQIESLGVVSIVSWPGNNEKPFTAQVARNGANCRSSPLLLEPQQAPARSCWAIRAFALDGGATDELLDRSLNALSLGPNDRALPPGTLVQRVSDAIYGRRVKLPSIDFGDFSTGSAAWIVAILCVAAMAALRNVVHQIFRNSDVGVGEAWLVLDARAPGEKVVAAMWIGGIALSGWAATFGLILSVMDGFQSDVIAPSLAAVGLCYSAFIGLIGFGTWAGIGITADLLRLRELRRAQDEAPSAEPALNDA